MKITAKFLPFVALACLVIATRADAMTVVASNNAEIRVDGASGTDNSVTGAGQVGAFSSGIRVFGGATSTLFFNVEGSGNFPIEDFPVADFALPAEAGTGIVNASLTLYEDPASFAAAGPIQVYLAANANPNLIDAANNPANGTPQYQTGNDGAAALDPAFAPFATMLGSAIFTPTGVHHTPTVVPLSFGGPELAHMLSVANSGGTLRLLVAPGAPGVAGTFAGQGNNDPTGAPVSPPALNYRVVPEPGSMILLWIGAAMVAIKRRRDR